MREVCVGGVRAVCLRVCVCVQPPKKHLNTVVMSWEGVWEAMRVVGAGGVGCGGRRERAGREVDSSGLIGLLEV